MAKSLFLVASLLLLLPLSLATPNRKTVVKEAAVGKFKVGEYQFIENIDNPYIQYLGNYAVAQYNKINMPHLRFKKVVCGKNQIVEGTNYDLLLIAFGGNITCVYEALIYVDQKNNPTPNGFIKIPFKH